MTHVEPEDILRRALHAAAESIEPATEGLTQIRARLSAPRPLAMAWLIAVWETVSQFVMLRLEAALDWLGSSLRTAPRTVNGLLYPATDRLHPVTERLRPALAGLVAAVAWLGRMIRPTQAGSDERRPRYAWVRPVAAMAAVVLVAVVGGFALSGRINEISQAASSVFSSGQTTNGKSGGANNSGVNSNGGGARIQPSSGPSGRNGASPTPSATCSPKPKATPKPSTAATPTQQPTTSQPTSTAPSTSPPSSPPISPSPSTSPPPTSGPDSSSTQAAQDSAVVIIGSASPSPSPSPCPSGHG